MALYCTSHYVYSDIIIVEHIRNEGFCYNINWIAMFSNHMVPINKMCNVGKNFKYFFVTSCMINALKWMTFPIFALSRTSKVYCNFSTLRYNHKVNQWLTVETIFQIINKCCFQTIHYCFTVWVVPILRNSTLRAFIFKVVDNAHH